MTQPQQPLLQDHASLCREAVGDALSNSQGRPRVSKSRKADRCTRKSSCFSVFACLLCCVYLQAAGELCPAVAQELGLRPGVIVSPGSGDNAMSALGAGITQ